jgi:hypothetical protein
VFSKKNIITNLLNFKRHASRLVKPVMALNLAIASPAKALIICKAQHVFAKMGNLWIAIMSARFTFNIKLYEII